MSALASTVRLAECPAVAGLGHVGTCEAEVRFSCLQDATSLNVVTSNHVVRIERKGVRFGFLTPTGEVIAPAHEVAGLECGGNDAVDAVFGDKNRVRGGLEVANAAGEKAEGEIFPTAHPARFSITPRRDTPGRIIARTGGVSPAFGLGDVGVRKRDRTELTGSVNEDFHGDGGQCGRLISNVAILPRNDVAAVSLESTSKVGRLTTAENAQGSVSATALPALYYLFGGPGRIYASVLEVRNREGYRVVKPKYEWFGVGWEVFGALAWDTNEKTVTEKAERYLTLGYPLSGVVVGSGFWPRQDSNMLATTSFGLWDTHLYPHPREFIEHFHRHGLTGFLGLRMAFITHEPFAVEGVRGGCILAFTVRLWMRLKRVFRGRWRRSRLFGRKTRRFTSWRMHSGGATSGCSDRRCSRVRCMAMTTRRQKRAACICLRAGGGITIRARFTNLRAHPGLSCCRRVRRRWWSAGKKSWWSARSTSRNLRSWFTRCRREGCTFGSRTPTAPREAVS